MKSIKYTISFIVVFIGLLIIGESHILRLNNFYTEFSYTTLFLQPNTTEEEMLKDIVNSAERNKVEVFTYIRVPHSTSLTEINIYGTQGVEKYINNNLNISEKEYKSLFLGTLKFDFSNIKKIQGIENIYDFYLIGSKENAKQFKMQLIDKYAGNHPVAGYEDKESRNNIIFIWLLIIIVVLLLSFYDVILQKKENLIKISLGERISKIIWKNIILDSLIYVILFIISILVLSSNTNVFFKFNISLITFSILIFSNALLYLNLFFCNIKEVFSNVKISKKLLSLNYTLKLITVIITVFIISSNIALVFESYKLYKQKSFFEAHSDYYYTNLHYKVVRNSDGSFTDRIKETAIMQETFYRTYFEKFNATILFDISALARTEAILANKNTLDYLSSNIKAIKNLNLEKDIYFILPKKMEDDFKTIDRLKGIVRWYEGDRFQYDYDIIYYDDDVNIIAIKELNINGSELLKNPIIIYNNISANKLNSLIYDEPFKLSFSKDIMYKITDVEFKQFIEKYDLINQFNSQTNVLEKYENHWLIVKKILYINLIFSVLVLFLEFIIIISIIKLEYEVNSIELSIKKIMGYSVLEKNKKIILMTVATTILSVVLATIVALISEAEEANYLAAGGTIIFILELFVIIFYINKVENAKIPKILKGGSL